MDFRRVATWVVFLMSSLFLVDAWQRYNGQVGFMNTSPTPVTTQPVNIFSDSVPAAPTSPAAAVTEKLITGSIISTLPSIKLSNEVLAIEVSRSGANIVRAELLKHKDIKDKTKHVVLLDSGQQTYLAQTGLAGSIAGKPFPNHTAATTFSVVSQTTNSVVLEAVVEGVKLTKTITLNPNNYAIDVKHVVNNGSTSEITPSLYLQLTRHAIPSSTGNFITNPVHTFTGPAVYTELEKFQKIQFSDIDKGKVASKYNSVVKNNETAWIAMVQHYFVSAWVAKDRKARVLNIPLEEKRSPDGTRLYSVNSMQALGTLAVGASVQHEAVLYVGPQDQAALEALAPGLRLVVDYGIFKIIAEPMFAVLQLLHDWVGNWGWAIILLTVIIKALLYLPMAMSYRSMAKMKNMAPKMKALKERFGDDKLKLQTATMELYRTEKINPLGGCLPILFTIPVFMSLYWVLLSSVEMRNAPWIGWIDNLAAPDSWYILPALLMVTMVVQFKLSPAPPDPTQAKVMMAMQGVFALMFAFFPSGLNIYYFVNNTLSIVQQWFITRQLEKEGLQTPRVKLPKPIKLKAANSKK
jgi:YidC/Oxa1 family membrane protein insertase